MVENPGKPSVLDKPDFLFCEYSFTSVEIYVISCHTLLTDDKVNTWILHKHLIH